MLVLLSASKKRMGSFITPTPEPISTKISSVASNAFKWGNYYGAALPSFHKYGGAFIFGNSSGSAKVSSFVADSFVFSKTLVPVSTVTYKDSSILFYSKTTMPGFTMNSRAIGMMKPSAVTNAAFDIPYIGMFIIQPAATTTTYVAAILGTQNTFYSPASESSAPSAQTLLIQSV